MQASVLQAEVTRSSIRRNGWCSAEIKELKNILLENETIVALVKGRYFGGFALLVATPKRLLLVDKKMLSLNVEDIRYDMICEVDYGTRLFEAILNIFTVNKQHQFKTINKAGLRKLTTYMQQRVMELRQYNGDSKALPQQRRFSPSLSTTLQAQPAILRRASHHRIGAAVGQVSITASSKAANPNPFTNGSLLIRQYSSPAA